MKAKTPNQFEMKPTGNVEHKRRLRARGWTNREAAKHLGYALSHFSLCLNGHRKSKTLLGKVWSLPARKEAAR